MAINHSVVDLLVKTEGEVEEVVEVAEPQRQTTPRRVEPAGVHTRVEFLSQMSVNNELSKLSLNMNSTDVTTPSEATNSNGTALISTLDESLARIEPNLLDEVWVNNILTGAVEQQVADVNVQQNIDNDAMLSTLNSNNSVVANDLPLAPLIMPNNTLFSANTTNDFALNNNTGTKI